MTDESDTPPGGQGLPGAAPGGAAGGEARKRRRRRRRGGHGAEGAELEGVEPEGAELEGADDSGPGEARASGDGGHDRDRGAAGGAESGRGAPARGGQAPGQHGRPSQPGRSPGQGQGGQGQGRPPRERGGGASAVERGPRPERDRGDRPRAERSDRSRGSATGAIGAPGGAPGGELEGARAGEGAEARAGEPGAAPDGQRADRPDRQGRPERHRRGERGRGERGGQSPQPGQPSQGGAGSQGPPTGQGGQGGQGGDRAQSARGDGRGNRNDGRDGRGGAARGDGRGSSGGGRGDGRGGAGARSDSRNDRNDGRDPRGGPGRGGDPRGPRGAPGSTGAAAHDEDELFPSGAAAAALPELEPREARAPRIAERGGERSREAAWDDDDEAPASAEPRVEWGRDDDAPARALALPATLPVEPDDYDPSTRQLDEATDTRVPRGDVVAIVGVRFTPAGRVSMYEAGGFHAVGDAVLVDSERGQRVGTVAVASERRLSNDRGLRRVLRAASTADLEREAPHAERTRAALRLAKDRVAALGLPVKVFRAEAQGPSRNDRMILYITTEERIDLRELVRDLSNATGSRVELRQLGARDEAKAVGGIGSCGLTLCCTTWLPEFVPVSIKMAKDQGLVLNPTKVAGQCGRLKCCLVYEQAGYAEMRKGLPKLGKRVVTTRGEGRVVEVDVLRQRVRVSYGPGESEVLPAPEVRPLFPSGNTPAGARGRGDEAGDEAEAGEDSLDAALPSPLAEDAHGHGHAHDAADHAPPAAFDPAAPAAPDLHASPAADADPDLT
jgi:cell fate regulator YaaT (PSP1 superfamily)